MRRRARGKFTRPRIKTGARTQQTSSVEEKPPKSSIRGPSAPSASACAVRVGLNRGTALRNRCAQAVVARKCAQDVVASKCAQGVDGRQALLLRIADERREAGAGGDPHDAIHVPCGRDALGDGDAEFPAERNRGAWRQLDQEWRLASRFDDPVDNVERVFAAPRHGVRPLERFALVLEAEPEHVTGQIFER